MAVAATKCEAVVEERTCSDVDDVIGRSLCAEDRCAANGGAVTDLKRV